MGSGEGLHLVVEKAELNDLDTWIRGRRNTSARGIGDW
jgi:hypothetical protein